MTDILFSSWGGAVVDNRGKPEAERAPIPSLNLPLEFEKEKKVRAFIGWDGIAIRDPEVNLIDLIRAYMEAVQKESCGKCTPCRVGTRVMSTILNRIAVGQGKVEDLDQLKYLAGMIEKSSKCNLGQTGPKPVLHALDHFKAQFSEVIQSKKKVPREEYKVKVTAPCESACPSHLPITRYVELIKEGRYTEALAAIREATCLAGVLGRVCIRPCEDNCRRQNVDECVSIKWLKRFVADYELEKGREPAPVRVPTRSEKVAIIGAGPAGLTCAYYLGLKGYPVTIFERLGEPGGMAAVGIPDYRLPRDIVRYETSLVERMGAEIRYNTQVGKDITLSQIFDQGYKAIFIGVGAHTNTPMGVEGEDKGYKGFIPGVYYLLEINLGRDPYPEGKKVVVVGGGNVAIDCVRSSFRIGKADVNLVYRRTKKEMPADRVEIHDAEEEGVKFHYLCNPVRIIEKDGKVTGMECIRMELGEPDESGRRRPVPIKGSEFFIEADIVIPAIGQAIDLSFLDEKDGVKTTKRSTIAVQEGTFQTNRAGIFSAGDCVIGPDVLVRGAGHGKRAAEKIDAFIQGREVKESEDERLETLVEKIKVYNKDEKIGNPGGQKRAMLELLPPDSRKWIFDEVEKGFSIPVAQKEAERCLRCVRVGLFAV
ncbi:MAG: dihydropyrimidine dehydrogenase subunit A [Deltaproteobacteria bacterium]|nr:dihydropyrimidine dehydrogenase subunit A [Deltaproteobacteria bacterium]